MTRLGVALLGIVLAGSTLAPAHAQVAPVPPLDLFFAATAADDRTARVALDALSRQWRDSYTLWEGAVRVRTPGVGAPPRQTPPSRGL